MRWLFLIRIDCWRYSNHFANPESTQHSQMVSPVGGRQMQLDYGRE